MQDTIFALATGSLGSAVAIVRVSGPSARSIAQGFCGRELAPRLATYAPIHDPRTGELIDLGLALFFEGPSSFTGEDCLEFQVHGSRAVVRRLLEALGRVPDARLAEPGEFIRRAFENGKISLTSVEGVADLIDARTEAQRRQALAQAGGKLAARASEWRDRLLDALSLVEAEIDFTDEGEAPSDVLDHVRSLSRSLSFELEAALSESDRAERIRSGFRVVVAGPPNAGKSSLVNALSRRDVAIVTDVAGTTRDIIEVELDLSGYSVLLCDTAGIRDTSDRVEAIGVERSRQALEQADLVLWLNDAREEAPRSEFVGPGLCIATKLDLVSCTPSWAEIGLSVRSGAGIAGLLEVLQARADALLRGEPPLITHLRQKQSIETASRHLSLLVAEEGAGIELAAEELRRAASALQGLLGRIDAEDVLGAIFARFCMGK